MPFDKAIIRWTEPIWWYYQVAIIFYRNTFVNIIIHFIDNVALMKKCSIFVEILTRLWACFWSLIRSSTIANRRLNLVRACSKFDRRWSMVDDLIGDQKQALSEPHEFFGPTSSAELPILLSLLELFWLYS